MDLLSESALLGEVAHLSVILGEVAYVCVTFKLHYSTDINIILCCFPDRYLVQGKQICDRRVLPSKRADQRFQVSYIYEPGQDILIAFIDRFNRFLIFAFQA